MTREDIWASGCSFGSLAAEIMKSVLDVHDEVTAGLGRWRDLFERGLAAMRERRELRRGANPGQLASAPMAAFQGGMLLSQALRISPLRDAPGAAIDYVAPFAPWRRRDDAVQAGGA